MQCRSRFFSGLRRRVRAPIRPKRPRRRLGDSGIGVLEESGDRFNGLGVAPHSQAADDTDQRPALELGQSVAQSLVNGWVGVRLQAVPGEVREFFVAQRARPVERRDSLVPTSASSRQASALSLSDASDVRTAISLASCSLLAGRPTSLGVSLGAPRDSAARQTRRCELFGSWGWSP